MNKRIISIIGLLVVIISLNGCNFTWQRYSSEEYGFSILLPRTWYKEERLGGAIITAISPREGDSDNFQENITVMAVDLPEEVSLEALFKLNKNEIIEAMPGDEFNVSEGEVFCGSTPGKWLSFNTRLGDIILRIKSAVWMKGKRVYTITCSAEYEQYPKYEPTFKKALNSLRIK